VTRSWRMFAGRPDHSVEGREFLNFGDCWYVRLYGHEPVAVELTEDPEGIYYGWIEAEGSERDSRFKGVPEMIQPHEGMFSMQFAYGPQAEVDRGRGEIVRMSCRAVEG
jgi:hypothetical protein